MASASPSTLNRRSLRMGVMNTPHRPRRKSLLSLEPKQKLHVKTPGTVMSTIFVAAFVVTVFVVRNVRVGISYVPGGVEGGVWWKMKGVGVVSATEFQDRREEIVENPVEELGIERKERGLEVMQRLRQKGEWPAGLEEDEDGLIPIWKKLNMSSSTMLNYFHMHKTGGVSTKVQLMQLFERRKNKQLKKKNGARIRYLETCYKVDMPSGKGVERAWRCDFRMARRMKRDELKKVDVVMGHQYWKNGCEDMFQGRDVRHFSMFRHPLPRKLSFFYHFFVRDVGRDENSVERKEVIDFLLARHGREDVRLRDAGPNYYASRLLSDGADGFQGARFIGENLVDMAEKRVENFAFVGLQTQPEASVCMLRKLVRVFAHAQGVDELEGIEELGGGRRLNSGGYPWTAREIWVGMTEQERTRYKEVEKVDLAIYDKVRRKFERDVGEWRCGDKVREKRLKEDIFE